MNQVKYNFGKVRFFIWPELDFLHESRKVQDESKCTNQEKYHERTKNHIKIISNKFT